MVPETIQPILAILKKEIKKLPVPFLGKIADETNNPYFVLISCIISLRTKDKVTAEASERLFRLAASPREMVTRSADQIAKAIYPASFYRNKAKQILTLSQTILDQHAGHVPETMDALLALSGVGRKTANLVLTVAFKKPGICVDTHVHRISNRLGFIKTQTPEESEQVLRETLPKKYWITYNDILVPYGQFVCRPISPFCSQCKINIYCDKVGVLKSR
ncbi:MAG: endonuclease III [Nitrospirota bacterium]